MSFERRIAKYEEPEHIMEDDGVHDLLQEPEYKFSAVTRQRALIAWAATGRKNDFHAVCKYYHFLEQYENTLSTEACLISRSLEFNAMPTASPQSEILQQVFPNLYTDRQVSQTDLNVVSKRLTSTESIIPASIVITNYLKTSKKDMPTFLNEFKDYTRHTGLSSTLDNLIEYIQNKSLPKMPKLLVDENQSENERVMIMELNESFQETVDNSLEELFMAESIIVNGHKLLQADEDDFDDYINNSYMERRCNDIEDLTTITNDEEKENEDLKENYADIAKKSNAKVNGEFSDLTNLGSQ